MDKKQQIIEAAIVLFAVHGFEKTSVSAICEKSNVSKGLVFHHFKNKDELLREVFARMADVVSDVSGSIDHSLPAKERLVQLIENIFKSMASDKHQLFYQIKYQVTTQPATRSVLIDLIESITKKMHDVIEPIFNEIPEVDGFISSRMMVAEIDGIALNYVFASDSFPLNEIKDEFIKKYLTII